MSHPLMRIASQCLLHQIGAKICSVCRILCLNRMRTVMSTSKVFIVHSYPRDRLSNETYCNLRILRAYVNKKLSYRRGTARCVVSVEVLPIATQQSRNYLYDKS